MLGEVLGGSKSVRLREQKFSRSETDGGQARLLTEVKINQTTMAAEVAAKVVNVGWKWSSYFKTRCVRSISTVT